MKNFLIISALTLPIGIFAQGPNTNIQINPQAQSQNINYYDQINDNNNSLGNANAKINDAINPIQLNIGNFQQQANPPVQEQQQSSGSFFGSNSNDNKPCDDCDEVKQAIKASKNYSSGMSYGKSFSMKKWTKKISGKADMKLRKMMAQKKKVKTSFDCCFNWG